MRRVCAVLVTLFTLAACGPAGAPTPRDATATAVSAFATFEALPPAVQQATQTAVAKKILEGLDATPTP